MGEPKIWSLPYGVIQREAALTGFLQHLLQKLSADAVGFLTPDAKLLRNGQCWARAKMSGDIELSLVAKELIHGHEDHLDDGPRYRYVEDEVLHVFNKRLLSNNNVIFVVLRVRSYFSADWEMSISEWLKWNFGFLCTLISPLFVPAWKQAKLTTFPHSFDAATRIHNIMETLIGKFETQLLKRGVKQSADDLWEAKGRREFYRGLLHFVVQSKPILFVLPAFPFKSINKETKVLSDLPDMGEKISVERLERFLSDVKEVYSPGAHLVLCGDGRVLCDLYDIPDTSVSVYQTNLRQMIKKNAVCWTDLDHFFPGMQHDAARVALEALFGTDEAPLLDRIRNDLDFNKVYNGFLIFAEEELRVILPKNISRRQLRLKLRNIARRRMMRNWSYGALIKCFFPHHIRLSVHPSSNSEKFSINMVGDTDWGTPWHNCALMHGDGTWSLIRKVEAQRRCYELRVNEDGLPYFYTPNDGPAGAEGLGVRVKVTAKANLDNDDENEP